MMSMFVILRLVGYALGTLCYFCRASTYIIISYCKKKGITPNSHSNSLDSQYYKFRHSVIRLEIWTIGSRFGSRLGVQTTNSISIRV